MTMQPQVLDRVTHICCMGGTGAYIGGQDGRVDLEEPLGGKVLVHRLAEGTADPQHGRQRACSATHV